MQRFSKQNGLSLVELMIAMTLGLLLLAGVVQIFLGSKQSYGTVMGMSQVLDNGRLSTHFLSDSLRKAGYWGDVAFDRIYGSDTGLTNGVYTGVFGNDEYVVGANNDSTDANVVDNTDQVWVRFNGSDVTSLTNCAGTQIAANQVAVERYYIRIPTGSENVPSLVCETAVMDLNQNSGVISAPASANATTQPLIAGVENMQLLFAQRNGGNTQVQYLTADAVTDWGLVEGVRIALLVASAESANTVARSDPFQLLDETTATPSDTRSRRVFEQMVGLRNPNISI